MCDAYGIKKETGCDFKMNVLSDLGHYGKSILTKNHRGKEVFVVSSIPHIIHYCWFGSSNKPKSVQAYINNWRKMLPGYTIMEWNETNCDIENEIDYVREAYAAKKYAFVSDYIRLKRLYEYGGIYFDTDVRVIKPFEECLVDTEVVLGLQSPGNLLTAFMATVPHHLFFKECIDCYENRHFINSDGSFDTTSINVSMDPFAEKYGLNLYKNECQYGSNRIKMYPIEYFSAFDIENWHPVINENTYTVHEMASSWRPLKVRMKIVVIKSIIAVIGTKNFDAVKRWFSSERSEK